MLYIMDRICAIDRLPFWSAHGSNLYNKMLNHTAGIFESLKKD